MRGRCSFFCSSLPKASSVGPIMVRPKPISGGGAFKRRISSASTLACSGERPPPPYARGQVGAVKPRSAQRSSQSFWSELPLQSHRRPPQTPSSSLPPLPRKPVGQFASSQVRVSERKPSRSDIAGSSRKTAV